MAVTQADIDALNAAIANDTRQVMIGAKQITYRSISELIAARNDLQNQLIAQTAGQGRVVRIAPTGRGY